MIKWRYFSYIVVLKGLLLIIVFAKEGVILPSVNHSPLILGAKGCRFNIIFWIPVRTVILDLEENDESLEDESSSIFER